MPITNLHLLSNAEGNTEYADLRHSIISQLEGVKPLPYFDNAVPALITIGIGFQIDNNRVNRDGVMNAMGLSGAEQALINNAWGDPRMAQIRALPANNEQNRALQNLALQNYLSETLGREFVMTPEAIRSRFDEVVGEHETAIATLVNEPSLEKIILTSLHYNLPGLHGLVGPGLRAALAMEDPAAARAEAWFEIRYRSGDQFKRRYVESALFGLYDSAPGVTAEEALAVYRMYATHREVRRQDILEWDVNNQHEFNLANGDLATFNLGITAITLSAELELGKQALLDWVGDEYGYNPGADGFLAQDILVGSSQTATTLDGSFGDDRNARNVLVGGDGADRLTGGTGDDVLYGGNGRDTYIYRTGDGNDRIVDPDGGVLRIDGQDYELYAAGAFIQTPGQNLWTRQVGEHSITLSHNSPWKLTLEDGSTIDLGENFNPSAFNMRLVDDQQAEFSADRTILGDLTPIDFDSSTDGIQTRGDDLGNIIVDPDQPSPDRDDHLFDSSGNDLILAGGGDDTINADRGGDDRLDGGSGDDIVVARAGADIVIGGSGEDLLRGDGGNDKIYADDELTVADALTQQDAAPSGLRGDFVDGGDDDDTIIGGIGNDALNGGKGADLILGGAGNDDIDGDLETSVVRQNWSVTRSITQSGGGNVYQSIYSDAFFSLPTEGGDDIIYGGAGSDWIRGRFGNDWIDGGSDDDVLFGEAGNDNLIGGGGNDVLSGDATSGSISAPGDDYLDGGDGNDRLNGDGGNDALFGGAGDDILMGGTGADRISGGSGNDQIAGDNGGTDTGGDADEIDGGDGDDLIDAQGGDDVVDGGSGNDLVGGGLGNDRLYGAAGDDQLQGGEGDDLLDGGEGVDLLFGGAGADNLVGGIGNDHLLGGADDDILEGGGDNDTLRGQDGNDALYGGDGNDHLLGGAGDDTLDGGSGNDVYYYTLGDGRDHIVDSGGTDWLVFSGGIFWNNVRLDVGSLKLVLPDGGEVHLDDFDPYNPLAGSIEYFQFSDNTVMTRQQLIQTLGFRIEGTPDDDTLVGTSLGESITAFEGNDVVTALGGNDTLSLGAGDDWADAGDGDDQVLAGDGHDRVSGGNGADRLEGGNGNDQLFGDAGADYLDGGAGDDTLSGGAGNDSLNGGDGNDIYRFGLGDGQDVAIDASGISAVQLTGGLTDAQVSFGRVADDLVLAVNGTTDRLTVKDYFTQTGSAWTVVLGDGVVLDRTAVEERLGRNGAPVALEDQLSVSEDGVTQASGNALSNDADPEGRTLRVTNPGTHLGSFGSLSLASNGSYTYTLNNASSGVQALAAGQVVTERFTYTISDDEPAGAATASSEIVVSISGRNDAPVANNDAAQLIEDSALNASGNLLANDLDVDAGTTLSVTSPGSYAGAYGTLTLAADGAYGYALDNQSVNVQSLGRAQQVVDQFSYTAADGIAESSASLTVTIAGSNDAPLIVNPLSDLTASPNSNFSWQLPTGTFTDVDQGDVLTYQARLADGSPLPTWLTFDTATQTLSGRTPRDASGFLDVMITATDSATGAVQTSNLSVSDVFQIAFEGGHGGGGGNGGGGSQGNAGVGNGPDAPPPGHDSDFNDGPGTAPGAPGAQGGSGLGHIPAISAAPVMTEFVIATSEILDNSVRVTGNSSQAGRGQSRKQDAPHQTASDPIKSGGAISPAQANNTGSEPEAKTDSQVEIGLNTSTIKEWWQGEKNPLIGHTQSMNQPESDEEAPAVPVDIDQLAATFARWTALDEQLEADKAKINGTAHAQGDGVAGVFTNPGQYLGAGMGLGQGALAASTAGADLKPLQGLSEGMQRIG